VGYKRLVRGRQNTEETSIRKITEGTTGDQAYDQGKRDQGMRATSNSIGRYTVVDEFA
jgi:hypothetical protein